MHLVSYLYHIAERTPKSGRKSLDVDFLATMERFQKLKCNPEATDILLARAVETGAISREDAERLTIPAEFRDPAIIEDILSLPQSEMNIVRQYGKVLESFPGPLRPLSTLPYSKEIIRKAAEKVIARTKIPEYKEALQASLTFLYDFIPDEEIPLSEEENKRKWMMLRFGIMDIDHLMNRAATLGENELLKIAFTNSHEYHEAAVAVAREELSRRGYTINQREDEFVVKRSPIPTLPPFPKP